MDNPAQQLHDLLRSWRVPAHQAPEATRAVNNGQARDSWSEQMRAVRLLGDVERLIDMIDAGGDRVEVYRRVTPKLYSAVFALTTPWSQAESSDRHVLDEHGFDILESLAGVVDSMRLSPDEFEQDLGTLRSLLADAEQAALNDEQLSDVLQRYILALVREALAALDDPEALTGERVRSIRLTLGGAMVVAAGQETKASSIWLRLSSQFLLPMASGAVGQVAAGLTLQQITGGH